MIANRQFTRPWLGLFLWAAGLVALSSPAQAQRVLTSGPVTPAAGSGSSQVFTFTATHSLGYTNITWISALITPDINSSLPGCNVWFHWSSGTIVLIDDSGGWPSRLLSQGGYLTKQQPLPARRSRLIVHRTGPNAHAGCGRGL